MSKPWERPYCEATAPCGHEVEGWLSRCYCRPGRCESRAAECKCGGIRHYCEDHAELEADHEDAHECPEPDPPAPWRSLGSRRDPEAGDDLRD